jgi:UDPglucose 6-dehydrogenase
MVSVGIIGNGFVGNATSHFKNPNVAVTIYDKSPDKCSPLGTTLEDLCKSSNIIFICLPTPMLPDGSCHLGIIENVVADMKKIIDFDVVPVVIRSTVPVGTSEKLNCFFMPEFLTEANPVIDFKNTSTWVFGLKNKTRQDAIMRNIVSGILTSSMLYENIVTDNSVFVDTKEAEAIKLFKNTFLAVKVGFCNEFYRFCQANNVNYNTVIDGVVTDKRITKSHTRVPGNNNLFGFGGTCFPKDICSLQAQMSEVDVASPIINAVIKRNNTLDRPQQEWKNDQGRAFINS